MILKASTAALCFLLAGYQQYTVPTHTAINSGSSNCPAVTGATYQWRADNTSCSGGGCSDGASVATVSDPVGSNTLTATNAVSAQPAQWYSNQVNGKPAWDFNGVSCPTCRDALLMTTGISSGSWTIFFFANRVTASTTDRDYLGSSVNPGALQLLINGSTNDYQVNRQTQAVVMTDGVQAANTWVGFGVEWNYSTNSGHIFTCPGGGAACTETAAGTSTMTAATDQIGRTSDDPPRLIAEVTALNSISGTNLTNIGTYLKCQYNY